MKLSLRHHILADLTTDELVSVGGASGLPCDTTTLLTLDTCVVSRCGCTGYYPSWNAPCSADGCA